MSVQDCQGKKITSSLPTIRKIAWRICANRDDVDELVQEVCLRLLSNWESVPENVTFNWLFSCVRNAFSDKYRKRVREQRFLERLISAEQSGISPGASAGTSPGESLGTSSYCYQQPEIEFDLKLHINAFLQSLSEEHRISALLLAEGATYEQIASVTRTKLGTVRSRIHYLRKKAQKELSDFR
jgi:RNA polymerase sigma-70 factor (ECF subfamily)